MATAVQAAPASVGEAIARRLAGFVRTLRGAGFTIGMGETRDALAVLASPVAGRRSRLQPALKALFCATRSDWERFDELFAAYWTGRGVRVAHSATGAPGRPPAKRRTLANAADFGAEPAKAADRVERREADAGVGGLGRRGGASRAEALAAADVRHIDDPEDMARAHELAARLARRMRVRLLRRTEARRGGRRLDLRRTIRRSIATGGRPIHLAWRRRKLAPVRLVMLLDASGSMSQYTAFFVRFTHGVVDSFREAEAFVFHTRLAHISPALRERNVSRAIERLALIGQGMGGGTRIGESLADFNRWHAKRVINARTVVVIVSDGYETGPPEQLATEMRRLRRRCRRIVWLNPLLGWKDYAPQARGMRAALPYVDLFAPAHNLDSLAALEPYLASV